MSVANYLLNDEPEPQIQAIMPTKIEPPRRRASSAKAPLPDLSRKMLGRAFVSTLEVQQSNIDLLLLFFKRKARAEDLGNALPVNSGAKRNICELKN